MPLSHALICEKKWKNSKEMEVLAAWFFIWVCPTAQIKAKTRPQLAPIQPWVGFKTVSTDCVAACFYWARRTANEGEAEISLGANCRSLQPKLIPAKTTSESVQKKRSPPGAPRYAAGLCKSAAATNSVFQKKKRGKTVKGWGGVPSARLWLVLFQGELPEPP